MSRFKLTRGIIIYKGIRYKQGDLLPVEFTEKDRWHTIAPHSIIKISDDEVNAIKAKAAPLTGKTVEVAAKATIKQEKASEGIKSAKVNPASPIKTTGTNPSK